MNPRFLLGGRLSRLLVLLDRLVNLVDAHCIDCRRTRFCFLDWMFSNTSHVFLRAVSSSTDCVRSNPVMVDFEALVALVALAESKQNIPH